MPVRKVAGLSLWLAIIMLFTRHAAHAACSSFSVSPLTFGAYTGAAVSVTETITLTCTAGAYQLGIGTRGGGTESARRMVNGANTLNFGVYQDAAYSIRWGNITGTDTKAYIGTGASGTVTIYGLIPAGQYPVPGSYTDQSIVYVVNGVSANPSVTATVSASCTVSATALNFGVYSGAQADATSIVTVTCTNTTPYYVNMGNGLNQDSSYYPRMGGPASKVISYRLYQNAARTTDWRNSYNVDGEAGTGNGLTQQLTVYGRIPAFQYVTPGAYSDTIVATVTY